MNYKCYINIIEVINIIWKYIQTNNKIHKIILIFNYNYFQHFTKLKTYYFKTY